MTELSVVVKIPANNLYKSISIPEDSRIADLLQLAAPAFGLQFSQFLFLKQSESGDPLKNSQSVSELRLERDAILILGVRHDAPLLYMFPFVSSDKIKKLLRSTKDYSGSDERGRNALHLAAEFSTTALKYLLKKKVFDIHSRDSQGNTALMYAAYSGDLTRITLLIGAGASARQSNNIGYNLLHFLCSKPMSVTQAQFEKVLRTVAEYDLHPYLVAESGDSPAHLACIHSNFVAIKFFLDNQYFLIDLQNGEGNTCLHIAVKNKNLYMVKQLLELKASKYVRNNAGELPLDIATDLNDAPIITLLNGDLPTRLIGVVWDIIKKNDLVTAKQVNVKYRDREMGEQYAQQGKDTLSSLQKASIGSRQFESKQDLYETVPYVKILNLSIHWAAARGNLDMLEYMLEEQGANPGFQDSEGNFALYLLCRLNSPTITQSALYEKCIKKCIDLGGSVNEKNPSGNTCLHIASLMGNAEAVKILLREGAFINTINNNGMSELFFAILGKNTTIIHELMMSGADPKVSLRSKIDCYAFAQKFASTDVTDLLSSCYAGARSTTGSIFKPNVAIVTVERGEGLPAKDDNGLSDPYCILRHRFNDLQCETRTNVIKETLTPSWNESFTFVIKHDVVYYRDLRIECFDWDEIEEGDLQPDDFIGSASLALFIPTTSDVGDIKEVIHLQDQDGRAGTIHLSVKYKEVDDAELKSLLAAQYEPYNVLEGISSILKATQQRSVGSAKAAFGFQPKYPVLIIPGLASSALECWASEKSQWLRERIWIDPFKIGKTAAFQKIAVKVKKKKKPKTSSRTLPSRGSRSSIMMGGSRNSVSSLARSGSTSSDLNSSDFSESSISFDETSETGAEDEPVSDQRRRWLRHLLTADDGFSDPPGIMLRPVPGLNGIDFLATNPLARKPSYVFGHLIPELINVGYTPNMLDAAPYDWRIPPEKLEARDRYFTFLKHKIQLMREINGEKVVLMGHSMGTRCTQYFLVWAEKNHGQQWIDDNVHAFLALGPPFLGAPKTVRAAVSGDCMGLEMFLTQEEGRIMARTSGSLPWLFPIQEHVFPDTIARVRIGEYTESSVKPKKSTKSKKSSMEKVSATDRYLEHSVTDILGKAAPITQKFFQEFYKTNPLYWNNWTGGEGELLPPVIEPPPVKNLWVIYGINLDTEVSYYFQPHKNIADRYVLDTNSDKYSNLKIGGINPRGLRIANGTGYETKQTFQPVARTNKSGDGTVPYCSLNYAQIWKEHAEEHNLPLNVQIFEIEGAEHREMLNHAAVFDAIINLVCHKPIG